MIVLRTNTFFILLTPGIVSYNISGMKRRITFTAPSPEKCKAFGIKHDGLTKRIGMWMVGVSSGVSFASGFHFRVLETHAASIVVECDSAIMLYRVQSFVEQYGFTCTERQIISDEKILTSGDLKD